MKVKQFLAWNKRLAVVYAVGAWTMVGGYAFYYYTKGRYMVPVSPPPALEPEFIEDTSLEDQPKKKRIQHTIVYKENFVPYSTRVYNLWNSVFGTTSETTRNMDKVEK
ncbi:small integral membrane protein 26 [Pelobates fuscus]|uniref:small integral membrane protein 26 n=1 Tax=Pelobates fuscus TaxID=191477 RepID=UPI002FE495B1